MFTGRYALARHQKQSLVTVLLATVVAAAIALSIAKPLRTEIRPKTPIPVSLLTVETEGSPSDTGENRPSTAAARNLDLLGRRSESTTQPAAAAEPTPTTDPPVTEPPTTDPPVTDPPVTEPPITDPPITDPPITEPPVTEPPVTEPPVTDPPEIKPSETTVPSTMPPLPHGGVSLVQADLTD